MSKNVFSDDDIKRLKEKTALVSDTWGIDRLLARLEAAENVLNTLRGHDAEIVDEDLMKAWRKAAGK